MSRAVRSPLVFALGALGILLVAMEVAWPGFFLHDDNATWFAGAYAHDFRTLTETGRLAEVNFYQYGGEPFLEQGQTAVLYPPVYVAGALAWLTAGDLRMTVDWLAAIHLALAVTGFYAWARRGGIDARLAAMGGLVWALNPFVLLLGASWIMVTAAAAWVPWLFWAVDGVVLEGVGARTGRQARLSPSLQNAGETAGAGGVGDGVRDVVAREQSPPVPGGHGLPRRSRFARPALGQRRLHAVALGVIAGMLVLQGYVQLAAYAFLFAGLYAAYQLFVGGRGSAVSGEVTDGQEPVPPMQRALVVGVAALIAVAISLPQVLPLVRGAAESKMRAQELSPMFELFYRVEPGDLLAAQVGFFREHFLFGASTALLFCPALVLLPIALVAFARGDEAVRRRLFPLLLLAGIALFFSGRGYFLLNVVPFMAKFRWPFKVFLFAEFFLIASLVWGCMTERTGRSPSLQGTGEAASPVPGGRGLPRRSRFARPALGQRRLPLAVLAVVLVLQVGVALWEHSTNFLSAAVLPADADLPQGMDPELGRVVAIGGQLPAAGAARLLTHAYSTYFEVPSLGGYNPLVSPATLEFACGLDIPSFWDRPITPEIAAQWESRAVRYWMVQANSPQARQCLADAGLYNHWPGDSRDVLVLEDTRAAPMAFDTSAPHAELPVRYSGNSMLIQLSGAKGTVAVSIGPTNGWWYRVNGGPWKQSRYEDYRLRVPVEAGTSRLEVSYFDPELRRGLCISLIIIFLLGMGCFIFPGLRRRYV